MSLGGFDAVLVIDLHFPDAGSPTAERSEPASLEARRLARRPEPVRVEPVVASVEPPPAVTPGSRRDTALQAGEG